MRKIIIADNQHITRYGLHYIVNLSGYKESEIIDADSKQELIKALLDHPSAIVIIDYTLFDFPSPEEMLIVRSRFSLSSWILFSEDMNDELLKQVLFSNPAFSVIFKTSSLEEIMAAFALASKNQRYLCDDITNHFLNPNRFKNRNDKTLTSTEKEILKEIASGKTTKEIALERNVSSHTIVSHRKNIFRKLEVSNVHEATKYAVRAGIIDISDYFI